MLSDPFMQPVIQDTPQASSASASGPLAPWLLGLIAMLVFLSLVSAVLLIRTFWFKKKRDQYAEEDKRRERMNMNENAGIDEEQAAEQKAVKAEDKSLGLQSGDSEGQTITAM
ncbi:small integral membrane protein 24-like [Hyperolius riggenbachi]|uniref:small integral membrane protein 24-like n=1 Tax=Hyperolius riggenbachi TaxID=752182 RepID=UPI0035A396FB